MDGTKTSMKIEKDIFGNVHFSGIINYEELAEADLFGFDFEVLDDCMREDRKASDWLLGLELIFRRLEQQREKEGR